MSTTESLQGNQGKSDVIDLGKLLGIMIDSRWLIISITFLFTIAGVGYSLLSTPIYKADTLLQVESKNSGMSGLGDMSELYNSESSSSTEIELIKSRMILGNTVDKLNLTTVVTKIDFPIVGKGLSRLQGKKSDVKISRFDLPVNSNTSSFRLNVIDAKSGIYELFDSNERLILTGNVGVLAQNNNISLFVTEISASDGDVFSLVKQSRFNATQVLKSNLMINEQGRQSGILRLSYLGENRDKIKAILDSISQDYFLQNVARNSAEAEKSLEFIKQHLPEIKEQLTLSEDALNKFRQDNDSIDLGFEAQATLKLTLGVEAQLNELKFQETEISQLYTKEHPTYETLLDKRESLLKERERLNVQVQKMPKTQRQVLRLTRDVEVNQQIYIQLLNKVQELNIAKASTVGNVRIIDEAQSYSSEVKPKKQIIVIIATLSGLIFAILISLLRAMLNRGVENPDDIEAIGLPVYACIPMSDWQVELDKKDRKHGLSINDTLLTISNPADLSIEALRSLRTTFHFAMMEAKNNILMISGPSPSIGKSFVSANMAAVVAKAGQRVLVIDTDMRKGRMECQMATTSKVGLSDYLSGQTGVEGIIKEPGVEGLHFISRGDVPPNPAELLLHPRFKELMEWASKHYDIVILDTPPILAVTDAAIVGLHAGTTFMVGRFGQNAVKEIEVAKQRFDKNGIEVKGFILNAVVRKASSYYGGNYGYYNYSYESEK